MANYHRIVFGLVRSLFLIAGGFFLLWTVLGVADLAIGLEWGYSWPIVIAGPLLAIAAYGGYRFIAFVEKIVLSTRNR